VILCYDLANASGTAWDYGIMKYMQEAGLREQMLLFLFFNNLKNGNVAVRIGVTPSDCMATNGMSLPIVNNHVLTLCGG
jgi:hypothetical protein